MIKGCERRMIKIEDPESETFEAAYFVIRQNVPTPKSSGREDILKEAMRVAEGRSCSHSKRSYSKRKIIIGRALYFGAGAALSALISAVMALL